MPRGDHANYQRPIKADQLSDDGLVLDYCQKYTKKEIEKIMNIYIGPCRKFNQLIEYVHNEKQMKENVTYFIPNKYPNDYFITGNVTYLGKKHPLFKKRMQISKAKTVFAKKHSDKRVIFLGIYHYNNVIIFCHFNTDDYRESNSPNSSANVALFDIYQAYLHGIYKKINGVGRTITTIRKDKLIEYFYQSVAPIDNLINCIDKINHIMPFNEEQYGVDSYKRMIENGFKYAKEAEWPGFFIEFLFSEIINKLHFNGAIKYLGRSGGGNDPSLELDLYFIKEKFYGDIKSSNYNEKILYGNKIETVDVAIDDYGKLWYLTYEYVSKKDKVFGNPVAIFWSKYLGYPDGDIHYASKMKYSITIHKMYIIEVNEINKKYLLKEKKISGERIKYVIEKKNIENFILYSYIITSGD